MCRGWAVFLFRGGARGGKATGSRGIRGPGTARLEHNEQGAVLAVNRRLTYLFMCSEYYRAQSITVLDTQAHGPVPGLKFCQRQIFFTVVEQEYMPELVARSTGIRIYERDNPSVNRLNIWYSSITFICFQTLL